MNLILCFFHHKQPNPWRSYPPRLPYFIMAFCSPTSDNQKWPAIHFVFLIHHSYLRTQIWPIGCFFRFKKWILFVFKRFWGAEMKTRLTRVHFASILVRFCPPNALKSLPKIVRFQYVCLQEIILKSPSKIFWVVLSLEMHDKAVSCLYCTKFRPVMWEFHDIFRILTYEG